MSATAETSLIPLRALNQATYCARLYYLEYVEAVMLINEHVEHGMFLHRRINDEQLASKPRKEGQALHTRSVELSSEQLGLTGKLDLIEERDEFVYPIEYKRSSAPRDEQGQASFYENDAIQVCGQALLLEEEYGRGIDYGVLYYVGSKERVQVPFTSELREKTRETIQLIRETNQRTTPPEPLPPELRHRCFGCSLAPICLPEETLFQRGAEDHGTKADTESSAITRVIPGSEMGAVLY
ncbi:MAG TPA: CRISPR-associated protein Cas4, partial [Gemmatales bacterium]|nr:CRISPR-associated protein Cas4 [Gemmatales bacterium]